VNIFRAACLLTAILVGGDFVAPARAQIRTPPVTPPPAAAVPAPVADALGRSTPHGTVLGFLAAARKGDNALARHYLNTTLPDDEAEALAQQLFVVLDTRLPARLTQVSGEPEGSRRNPLAPDEEPVGRIEGAAGTIDVIVERVKRPKAEPIWLFSRTTLDAIPDTYADITSATSWPWVPKILYKRIINVRIFDWLALVVGLPAFYFLTVLLNRALRAPVARLRRRAADSADAPVNPLPAPARLLLLSIASRRLFSTLPLSLLTRQVLTNAAVVIGICAIAWLAILLTAAIEHRAVRRLAPANYSGAVSLLRLGRRFFDVIVIIVGVLAIMRHFGIDVTPLLAGLGVGGIAVALAAQKTLENVIAGASLIFDQAVRVGDFLKVGPLEGTVEHIGLRSTRIRTLDRTVVSVPNGQIANMSLETLSARDKFWFHPTIGLRYETTPDQVRIVVDRIRAMLARHAEIDGASVRVRFLRLGTFSLDVEVFAYLYARDWPHFLEIQESLLLTITEIVRAAGAEIAFPSQTMYLSGGGAVAPELPVPK
jgi:MscS family membrane protein